MQLKRDKHKLRSPCCITCKKNCIQHIPESLRTEINTQYWTLSKKEQDLFVVNSIERKCVQRRRGVNNDKRNWSISYLLKNSDGLLKYVCKQFYLATLGFSKNNDFIIQKICSSSENNSSIIVSPSNNSKQEPWNKIDVEPIKSHINSFNPSVAHYRREHAPLRKYLSNEITATFMWSDFQEKNPDFKCSYDMYRQVLRKMNISFTKLGHEECESCETFIQHDPNHNRHNVQENIDCCDECKKWSLHFEMYTNARKKYDEHSEKTKKGKIKNYTNLSNDIILLKLLNCFIRR